MGHDASILGAIYSPLLRGSEEPTLYHELNIDTIQQLPMAEDDTWPWLIQDHFSWSMKSPQSTYRDMVIHFAVSLKDAPPDGNYTPPENRTPFKEYLEKLEALLSRLDWSRAEVFFETDFDERRWIQFAHQGSGGISKTATFLPRQT